MKTEKILYLGDTALKEAASYLAGVLTHFQIDFDYQSSDQPIAPQTLDRPWRALILSDYPAANFTPDLLNALAQRVDDGLGLLMIGGWESFTGAGSQYTHTPLKDVLPVIMKPADDRLNCSSPCLAVKNQNHPILADLPFDAAAPTIGGYNQLQAKPEAQTILSAQRFNVSQTPAGFDFDPLPAVDPLLVLGTFGKGRTAAFASDVAPHWVGGLVDWGDSRIIAQGKDANPIEVGNWYARFFAGLVRWTAAIE